MAHDYNKMLFGSIYYDSTDLRYSNQYKFFLTNQQLIEYKQYKDNLIDQHNENMFSLDLKTYNSKHIFYTVGSALINLEKTYLKIVLEDLFENESTVVERNYDDMIDARVYSELEGSMQIENIPTTRTKLEQIRKGAVPQDKNEIIARNMISAIDYIKTKPSFTKENLYKLYTILSQDCLEKNQELQVNYYRDNEVYIDKYEGCPVEKIEECMDSLFKFVDKYINDKNNDGNKDMLPHICHYYILYVHPYFDYNGRTARMVSLWISMLLENTYTAPLFISEAINDNKRKYYDALRETRDMDNDLTYFLIYILNTAIRYSLVYRNINYISDELIKEGITITHIETIYIKKILLGADGYFDYKKFLVMANITISKQAALKELNKLAEYGLLSSKINDKKVKLFKINDEYVKYSTAKFTN
ncbi:MAG: Fic family protein [Clostridia bacterium]|nr:Fic family protein [Clostridia bacterium]